MCRGYQCVPEPVTSRSRQLAGRWGHGRPASGGTRAAWVGPCSACLPVLLRWPARLCGVEEPVPRSQRHQGARRQGMGLEQRAPVAAERARADRRKAWIHQDCHEARQHPSWPSRTDHERPVLLTWNGSDGSGCDSRPFGFIARKLALKVGYPQAAVRQRAVSTLSCRWTGRKAGGKADIAHQFLANIRTGELATAVHRSHVLRGCPGPGLGYLRGRLSSPF